jgi:hypothetical protein
VGPRGGLHVLKKRKIYFPCRESNQISSVFNPVIQSLYAIFGPLLMKIILTRLLTYILNYLLTYLLTYSLTHSLTHSPTPWSRVLLEQLTSLQLVKKFPAFYGTRRFIAAFTSAHPLSIS